MWEIIETKNEAKQGWRKSVRAVMWKGERMGGKQSRITPVPMIHRIGVEVGCGEDWSPADGEGGVMGTC